MYGYNSEVLVIGDYYYLGSHVIGLNDVPQKLATGFVIVGYILRLRP